MQKLINTIQIVTIFSLVILGVSTYTLSVNAAANENANSNAQNNANPSNPGNAPSDNPGNAPSDNPGNAPSDNPGNQPEFRAYCHANSGASEFNYHYNPAWVQHFLNNGSTQAGHETDFFTWEGDTQCVGYTYVCVNSEANNYVEELAINEKAGDDSLCDFPAPSTPASAQPSSSPSSSSTPSDNNSSSNNDDGGSVQGDSTGAPSGEVLGTYAATGVAQDVIMNALGSVGSLITMAGSVLYGQKSKKRS